jgi:hypothetical protein
LYLDGGSDGKWNQVDPISQPFALWRKKIWLNFAHQNDLCTFVIARNLFFLIWNFHHNGIWIHLHHNQLH